MVEFPILVTSDFGTKWTGRECAVPFEVLRAAVELPAQRGASGARRGASEGGRASQSTEERKMASKAHLSHGGPGRPGLFNLVHVAQAFFGGFSVLVRQCDGPQDAGGVEKGCVGFGDFRLRTLPGHPCLMLF